MDGNVNRTVKDGANGTKKHPDPPFIQHLMVMKVYLRDSEDSITSARQKVHTLQAQIESAYITIKNQQEDEEEKEAMQPNHLQTIHQSTNPYPQ